MGRRVRDANLETRTARLRLLPRGKPYWRALELGLHLGFRRRLKGGGTWIARRLADGSYLETSLGIADDLQDADGVTVLSYSQAQEAARALWKAEERRARGLEPATPRQYTVEAALADYERDYLRRGGKDIVNLRSITRNQILPHLGPIALERLTSRQLRDWHHGLAQAPRYVRTKDGSQVLQTREFDQVDPEAVRKRRARANRVLTVVKAAFNRAFSEGMVASDDAWRRVSPFRNVDRATLRYLSREECIRLLNACDCPFRALVRAALLTGARYQELARLRVDDFDSEARTLHIRESKSGKPRHVPLVDEATEFLHQLSIGRHGREWLLVRADGQPWKPSQQARPLAIACARARIDPPITFHGLRDTFASMLAMKNVSLSVIAAVLGHADTRITEKFYAHLSASFVADTIRANMPTLLPDRTPPKRINSVR